MCINRYTYTYLFVRAEVARVAAWRQRRLVRPPRAHQAAVPARLQRRAPALSIGPQRAPLTSGCSTYRPCMPHHICAGTWAHPRPHLRRDLGSPPPTSAPGLADRLAHICAGTAPRSSPKRPAPPSAPAHAGILRVPHECCEPPVSTSSTRLAPSQAPTHATTAPTQAHLPHGDKETRCNGVAVGERLYASNTQVSSLH